MSAETNQQAELSTYRREEIGSENTSKQQELSQNYSSLGSITGPDDGAAWFHSAYPAPSDKQAPSTEERGLG